MDTTIPNTSIFYSYSHMRPPAAGKRWTDDGKCGKHSPLWDGSPAQCDPDGQSPCCNDEYDEQCGNTTEHCLCDDCTDYRLLKDWKESGGTQKWRYDGRCGGNSPLPDDTPSQCDPDGNTPCCSHVSEGNCGNSTEHCSCEHCTDYSIVYKEWRETQGKQKWRSDKKCGFDSPLPDGTPAQCDPDGENPCCNDNYQGKCGNTTEHCTCEQCTDFKILYKEWRDSEGKQKWRYDQKCGSENPLPDGTSAQCDPDGENPCCDNDENGNCGNTDGYCSCEECTDYINVYRDWKESGGTQKWRSDKKCGSKIPLPDGTSAQCDPDGDSPCCDDDFYGTCGNTAEHCSCDRCKDFKFLKDWEESGGTLKWRRDGRCGSEYPLPDGSTSECDPDGKNNCCSHELLGYCGFTWQHCYCSSCKDYKFLKDWKTSGGRMKWRGDGRCGSKYPLPDGTPSQCEYNWKYPCCNDEFDGRCGNGAEYCSCEKCTDYSIVYKEWKESGGTQKWRYDGRCGGNFPLPNNSTSQCDPDGESPCCSNVSEGNCGNSTEHCSCEHCTDYRIVYKEWRDSEGKQKWRYDRRCGFDSPLPDGTPAQCDPDGENPCCNDEKQGKCGNTTEHCTCEQCTDFKILYKEWRDSEGNQKWRYDKKCGSENPLPDGTPAQCDPDGENPCCDNDENGNCGNTDGYCSCEECTDYRIVYRDWKESGGTQKWRSDKKCGSKIPLPDGTSAQCDPDGDSPCCDDFVRKCGNGSDHCTCDECKDYKFLKDWEESGGKLKWRLDRQCGSAYPLPNGTPSECDPDGENPCCTQIDLGYCGNTTEHCSCEDCTDYRIIYREWRESGGKQRWRYDGRCGSSYLLPDGALVQCDPDGENPCCNAERNGKCMQNDDCICKGCTDYELLKTWEESGRTLKWRHDGRCGSDNPLPDGTTSQCDPDGDNPCCDAVSDGQWCRNATDYCTCEECTDYRIVYKEWTESLGKQKWRYDKKCGYNNLLPDGAPAECDPTGENPCCDYMSEGSGTCGNTAGHCSCPECTNYRIIYIDWEESKGERRWRYDGRCGFKFPLPDGTPAECDPAGEKPCCNRNSECSNNEIDNACLSNVDFRVVQEIRDSGENCSFARLDTGFLKIVCYNESTLKQYFKCANSDVYYDYSGESDNVTEICKNDSNAYQRCGLTSKNEVLGTGESEFLCGGYYCEQKTPNDGRLEHGYIDCPGSDCDAENRDCKANDPESIWCDDRCDSTYNQINEMNFCIDESNCNGYRYGVNCKVADKEFYFAHQYICAGRNKCYDGYDEKDCNITNSTLHTCTHYGSNKTVPILDYTRCSVMDTYLGKLEPYCLNYMDQTNCSDIERVGGYCEVNGFNSSVSKYVVCKENDEKTGEPIKLCINDEQNECLEPKRDCRIHKHKMCDGLKDCSDGSDEFDDMCKITTDELKRQDTDESKFTCTRKFNPKKGEYKIPVSWIMDNKTDCMNGEDENIHTWKGKFCSEETRQFNLSDEPCADVYKCPRVKHSFVLLQLLCDGVESCGKNGFENQVCVISRDFPVINKSADYDGPIRSVCDESIDICETREFIRPWGDVLGARMELKVPTAKVKCNELFGEYYLFLSCMGLCQEEKATCPIKVTNRKLEHISCPGQYLDRTYTLGNYSFLTFLDKSDDGQYHQDFYRCKNNRCVEYKQVCDLVDDCGDMSDEINCANHLICNDTLHLNRHQFIALSQKCDGIYDCFDLSDECNDECGREILGNWVIKITCWFMGILAILFNLFTVVNESLTLKDCETEQMMISKVLMSLIGSGDFLIGLYLVIISIYDSIIFGKEFCGKQAEWLSGTPCLTLGVMSTFGSQVSLFTMTILSVIRMYGLTCAPMRVPRPVSRKSILKIASLVMMTITAALMVAVTPLVPSLEDYFVQGMYYDPSYKVFIGFPNKERHEKILKVHYNTTTDEEMTWKEIAAKVDGMFSHEYGNLTRSPVHFYGNDGVCLYKYVVKTNDARRSRQASEAGKNQEGFNGDPVVWTMLAVNLFCFIVITFCYIVIICKTRQSSQRSGQQDNQERQKNERAIQNKIMIIITTDFLCWVPFIFISGLHNLEYIDASTWYSSFAMIVLPFNSVINPIVYDKALGELISKKFGWLKKAVRYCTSPIVTAIGGTPRNVASEGIQKPEVTGVTAIE